MLRQAALLALLIASGIQQLLACSCIPPTVEDARSRADAVFLGAVKKVRVLEPNNPGSKVIVEFTVSRVWKGKVTKEFEMRSVLETSFCEGFFKDDLVVGKQLLVFANRTRSGFIYSYSTNICTPTGPPERYGNTLAALGQGKVPEQQ